MTDSSSLFSTLLATQRDRVGADSPAGRHLTASAEALEADADAEATVFLTVLLRTQGKRPEPLRDALLSLAAQTDRDFEVVVVGHDVGEAEREAIDELLGEYAPLLPQPARYVEVTGGTRARPLNAGFAAAAGAYVAVFDDDDVLFAHWVAEFHTVATEHPGRLLRAVTATQRVSPETWPGGRIGYRTLSWPLDEYEKTFDQLNHLSANRSPFMSIAFPRLMLVSFGIAADEELVVCEDWDLILQGAFLLGVADVPAMTSIYHRWENGVSSYTLHDQATWRESEARVRAKLDRTPLLLAPGQIDRIRELLADEGVRAELANVMSSTSWRLTAPVRSARRYAAVTRGRLSQAARRIKRLGRR